MFDFFLMLLDYAVWAAGEAFMLFSIAEIFMMLSPIPASLLLLPEDFFYPHSGSFLGLLFLSQHFFSFFVLQMRPVIMVYICIVNRSIVQATYVI
jgi:hypothetical protein